MKSISESYKTKAMYVRHALLTNPFFTVLPALRRKRTLLNRHFQHFLELEDMGYTIIQNYMSEDECREAVIELKKSFHRYNRFVHHSDDKRIFGLENILPVALRFSQDLDFLELGELINREYTYCAFTLGGWLKAGGSGSSGNGWHRDAFLSQFKAMVYLTDVGAENGPFEILPGSHHVSAVMRGIKKAGLAHMQDRLTDKEVDGLEQVLSVSRKTITGCAGTLVLFNSSTVHRGQPIKDGERLALTNYYFPISRELRLVRENFSPLTAADV